MHGAGRAPGSDAGGRMVSERVELWKAAHEGEVVPLYERPATPPSEAHQ